MDEATLIEDIISTKNTLTILRQVFTVNKISLQPFSPIFDSITELIDILTHSSVKQIETTLLSTGPQFSFNKLKDTLNDLTDAITTKDTSTIALLNEQLSSSVQKLRLSSSYTAKNEETAEDMFKKNLVQPNIATKNTFQFEDCVGGFSDLVDVVKSEPTISHTPSREKEELSITDPFAQFRFARRRRSSSTPSEKDEDNIEVTPASASLSPPPPPSRKPQISRLPASSSKDQAPMRVESPPLWAEPTVLFQVEEVVTINSSKIHQDKPRLMISYNHASKPLCTDIYNRLTNDGYDVWIDLKEMHGSTLAAMAQGIEDSDIFLFCVTQNYSQSPNCQKEAEYAFVREKIMIPLLLQSKYKPTGWLGLLMGASLYIDFTKNDFIENYVKLKNEIELNASRINNNKNDVPKLTLDSTTNGEEHTHNLSSQSTNTNSTSIEKKSRSCVLF